MTTTNLADTLCATCRKPLGTNDPALIVQNPVYDFLGELEYIELAHRVCEPAWAVNDRHFEEQPA